MQFPYILISIVVAIILFALLFVVVRRWRKGEEIKPDYRTMFILGIVFLLLGLFGGNLFFFTLGIVFMIVGLANKNKWEKKSYRDISPSQKTKFKIILLSLLVLAIIGVVGFFLSAKLPVL